MNLEQTPLHGVIWWWENLACDRPLLAFCIEFSHYLWLIILAVYYTQNNKLPQMTANSLHSVINRNVNVLTIIVFHCFPYMVWNIKTHNWNVLAKNLEKESNQFLHVFFMARINASFFDLSNLILILFLLQCYHRCIHFCL